jgi:hypothetical protein
MRFDRCDGPVSVLVEISVADEGPSRGFPIHLFTLILGIIGTREISRKETYWPSRPVCAGDWIVSVNN